MEVKTNEQKKVARPSAPTLGQADEDSNLDFTAAAVESQHFISILDLLPIGAENAVSAKFLASLLETDARAVTRLIEDARRNGAAICANRHGFYRASDLTELSEYVARLRNRILSICCTEAALTSTLDAASGQTRAEGF